MQREQNALRAAEEQKKLEEKYRNQQQTRQMLDLSLQLKMKKKAKQEQEELAFDLKMLEQLLEESRNEAMEQIQRKVTQHPGQGTKLMAAWNHRDIARMSGEIHRNTCYFDLLK